MIRFWRKAKLISFYILILCFIFIAFDCEKKPPTSPKNAKSVKRTKDEPRTYEELEQGRLSRIPKKGKRFRRMAFNLMHEGRYEAALQFLREELKSAVYAERIGTMSDMAHCFREIGENDSAINLYQKCQLLAESLNFSNDLGASCAEMGQIYCQQGEYKKALPLFEKSLELSIKTKDHWNIAASYLDFADFYLATQKYKAAKENALKALEISEEKGIEQLKIIALNRLEMIDNAMQNYDSSKTILREHEKTPSANEGK